MPHIKVKQLCTGILTKMGCYWFTVFLIGAENMGANNLSHSASCLVISFFPLPWKNMYVNIFKDVNAYTEWY